MVVLETTSGIVAGEEKRAVIWDCHVLLGEGNQEGDEQERPQWV